MPFNLTHKPPVASAHPAHSCWSMSGRFENTQSRWPKITDAVLTFTKMKTTKTVIQLYRNNEIAHTKWLHCKCTFPLTDFLLLSTVTAAGWLPDTLYGCNATQRRCYKETNNAGGSYNTDYGSLTNKQDNRGQEQVQLNMFDFWLQPRST